MLIQCRELSVTFRGVEQVTALNNLTLSIQEGEWITILGPSGSGKTTLLNAIGGMVRLTSGEMKVNNRQITHLGDDELQIFRREMIGYVFQDYRLFDQFNVLENVMLPQWPYQPRKILQTQASELLDKLQMNHRAKMYPTELSGGEKQRTAIARALLNDPKILLCDEPTGNLDIENREIVMRILEELHQEGVTIILVTHDHEVATRGTRLLSIRDGMLVS